MNHGLSQDALEGVKVAFRLVGDLQVRMCSGEFAAALAGVEIDAQMGFRVLGTKNGLTALSCVLVSASELKEAILASPMSQKPFDPRAEHELILDYHVVVHMSDSMDRVLTVLGHNGSCDSMDPKLQEMKRAHAKLQAVLRSDPALLAAWEFAGHSKTKGQVH